MPEEKSGITTSLTLLLGALVGMVGLILVAWQTGFLDWDRDGQARSAAQSATPGMDKLNAYQCRRGETKHLIVHGIEDNFSSKGDETIPDNGVRQHYRSLFVAPGEVGYNRNYDEPEMDNALTDQFLLPSGTVHGIFVTKVRELSSLKNDTIRIGDVRQILKLSHYRDLNLARKDISDIWLSEEDLLTVDIADITFHKRKDQDSVDVPQIHADILQMIRATDGLATVDLMVLDDTMVDFAGFALCAEPDQHMGTTFLINPHKIDPPYISLSCTDLDATNHCYPYTGETLCTEERPLACFLDSNTPVPDALKTTQMVHWWSGGELKFTIPVKGNRFATADDAHEFCQTEFGDDWRTANSHEGISSTILVALGDNPGARSAWIDMKAEPYGSCWTQRPDYEDLEHDG